jgi:hypothetical protein
MIIGFAYHKRKTLILNPQKHGFGKRIMFLSNNLNKFDFLKAEDHANKIEGI